ncbi:toxin biosynthesis cytochrome P450 monooxygenase [Stipitochalara longipes BDJ]|nr:toxin biosynthesis cytochrome P450 monooxygenase [Stipitochalara longipes BDJ]
MQSFMRTPSFLQDELSGLSWSHIHLFYLSSTYISKPYLIASLTIAFYNITLHPLAKFPGPKLYGAFYFPLYWHNYTGNLATVTKDLHEKYGSILRLSPTSLSFTSPEAVQDIYTHPKGSKPLQKDPELYHDLPGAVGSDIIVADDTTHARYRRILNHAFSPSALRSQEPLIQTYSKLLISRLTSLLLPPQTQNQPLQAKINIVAWLNFTTFDLISDLTFGSPLGALESGEYHPWMSAIFENVRVLALMRSLRAYALTRCVVELGLRVPVVRREINRMRAFTEEKTRGRLGMEMEGKGRRDLMSYILKYNDDAGMNTEEIISSSRVILAVSSETTATALSGLIFYLLTTPRCFERLKREIRGVFESVEEMTFEKEKWLRYLQACVEEVLRVYPPVAMELSRVTPREGWERTSVAAPHIATSLSPLNFTNPQTFIPERWLDDPQHRHDKLAASQPFSLGARSCVGKNLAYAEIRSIIVRLVWHFEFELCEESVGWREQKAFLLWEKGALWVRIESRKGVSGE